MTDNQMMLRDAGRAIFWVGVGVIVGLLLMHFLGH